MIIVTGGAGFIGSNFVLDWVNSCDEPVVTLDKLTYAGNPENLASIDRNRRHHLVKGDIGDPGLLRSLLRTHKPRAIINFAAESHVDRSIHGPADFIETNVVGTFQLLESTRAYWNELNAEAQADFRFLHVSTDEVYGSLGKRDPAFTETTPYSPNSPYAASKAASDHLVRAWHHTYGIPVLTTNCSNNYGPYQFPEKLIPLMILNAIHAKPLPIYGDGKNVRDWLFVTDHCRAIRRVLEAGRPGETYNIGGNSERTNMQVVHALCDILDRVRPNPSIGIHKSLIHFVKDRPGHDQRYAMDSRKIQRELGWKPTESFESGLEKTVSWYLDHSEWSHRITSGAYREWIEKNYAERVIS